MYVSRYIPGIFYDHKYAKRVAAETEIEETAYVPTRKRQDETNDVQIEIEKGKEEKKKYNESTSTTQEKTARKGNHVVSSKARYIYTRMCTWYIPASAAEECYQVYVRTGLPKYERTHRIFSRSRAAEYYYDVKRTPAVLLLECFERLLIAYVQLLLLSSHSTAVTHRQDVVRGHKKCCSLVCS